MEPESRAETAQTERRLPAPMTLAAGESPEMQEAALAAAVSNSAWVDTVRGHCTARASQGDSTPDALGGLLLDGAEGGERTAATKREKQAPNPLEAMLAAANAAGGLTRVMPTLSSEEYAQRERAYEAMSACERSGNEDLGGKV